MSSSNKVYTVGEEIANSVSHGIGMLISCSALALLIYRAVVFGDGWDLASAIVFGVTLFMLYTASTLYHAIPFTKAKVWLKRCDHIAIYFLIAGTYTPFALVVVRPENQMLGWIVFGVEWGCALFGCIFKAFFAGRWKMLSTLFYVVMGWVAIAAIHILWKKLPPPGFWLLVSGGLTYTLGAVFYAVQWVPYFHSLWHLFVLAGSILHFLCVLMYVIGCKH